MSDIEVTVDEHDMIIGSKPWWEMTYDDIYRVSAVWITDKGTSDILLAQRKWTKKKNPGKWGTAAAGTIEVGETYDENIVKEIEEEIGLTGLSLIKGPKIFTDEGQNRYFCQWYIAQIDKQTAQIVIQEEEVEATIWITKDDLFKDLLEQPEKYVPTMVSTMHKLGIR